MKDFHAFIKPAGMSNEDFLDQLTDWQAQIEQAIDETNWAIVREMQEASNDVNVNVLIGSGAIRAVYNA